MRSAHLSSGIPLLTFLSACVEVSCASIDDPDPFDLQVSLLQVKVEVSERIASTRETRASGEIIETSFLWKCFFMCTVSLCIMVFISMVTPPKSWVVDGSHGGKVASFYRPDIDGLRAVAVTAVVVFHIGEEKNWLAGGWVGVDIFYVISGYVVTCALIRHELLSSWDGCVNFYASRVKRLVPNCLCTIVVTGLLTCLFVPKWPLGWEEPLKWIYVSGSYAAFSAANIFFAMEKASYWDTGASSTQMNPYTHMWSLGVEEQYYLVYPMILILLHGQAPTKESARASYRRPLTGFAFLALFSFVRYIHMLSTSPEAAFYSLPCRFWELAIGGWLYEFQASYGDDNWSEITSNVLVRIPSQFLAITLIVAAICMPKMPELPDTIRMCMGTLGAVCCIVGNSSREGGLRQALSVNGMVGLGKMSYSIYLWHWPIFTMFRWTFGLASPMLLASSLLLLGVFASGAYHFIEKPLRQWPLPAREVFFALVVGVVICQCLLLGFSSSTLTAVPPLCPSGTKLLTGSSTLEPSSHNYDDRADPCACELNTPVLHVPPSAITDSKGGVPFCFAADFKISMPPQRRILIVGDSHTLLAKETLEAIQPARNKYNISRLENVCVGLVTESSTHGSHTCGDNFLKRNDYRENVYKEIKQLKKNDILILAHCAQHPTEPDLVREIQQKVAEQNASLILFGASPLLKKDMTQCVPSWVNPHADDACSTTISFQDNIQKNTSQIYSKLAAELPSTYYFERWRLYCNSEVCNAFIPGTCTIAYLDEDHVNEDGSRYSSPFMCSFMNKHGLL